MENLTGRLIATTALEIEVDKQALIDEINRVIKPAKPATLKSVYLGVLYVASNQINAQGGCFAEPELSRLAELIVDTPVLIGHKKTDLPIGRVFKGEIVRKNDSPWLRAFFYWHKDQAQADELKTGIDAGIYRECSLGFTYGRPECGICREDMRECRHRVHERVTVGRRDIKAFYYYREIEKVLEISLVYRGAVAGTSVSTLSAANAPSQIAPFWRHEAKVIFEPHLDDHATGELLIEPLYRGVWLKVDVVPGGIAAAMPSGESFDHPGLRSLRAALRQSSAQLIVQALPVRGATRLPLRTLLDGKRAPRLRWVIFDLLQLAGRDLGTMSLLERRRLLRELVSPSPEIIIAPLQSATLADLALRSENLGTALGMRIFTDPANTRACYEWRRQPLRLARVTTAAGAGDAAVATTDITNPSLLATNSSPLCWLERDARDPRRWRIVDCAIGESQPDASYVAELLAADRKGQFALLVDAYGHAWLVLHDTDRELVIKIAQLQLPLLAQGRRFWCALIEPADPVATLPRNLDLVDRGTIELLSGNNDALLLLLDGRRLRGSFTVTPTMLSEHRAHLFSRLEHLGGGPNS